MKSLVIGSGKEHNHTRDSRNKLIEEALDIC